MSKIKMSLNVVLAVLLCQGVVWSSASRCCPTSNEWTLVFKGVEGIGGNLYSLLTSSGGMNEDTAEARALTNDFNGHYKNHLMDRWEAIGVTEVKFALYSNGQEKVSMVFNGLGSNKENWFSKERLRSAPWGDLMDEDSVQYFSMAGHHQYSRHFYVNKNYGGCPSDAGWMIVVDDGGTACSWSNSRAKPYFMYSPGESTVVYENGGPGYSDVMAIFIKHQFDHVEPADQGWQLVLKAVSGNGESVYDLWAGNNDGQNEDNCQAKELNTDFSGHYKSAKVDDWTTQSIKQVKVAVYEECREKMFMVFDGEGSDKMNWFSKDRLTSTSYSDLDSSSTTNFFSIIGHESVKRSFFVNRNYGGCGADAGWLVVADIGPVACVWSEMYPRPYFLYGEEGRRITYQSGSADIGNGDVLAVFIKS